MLICLPNVFYSYYILLLFPAIALAGYCWSQCYWRWLCVLLVLLSCLLIDDSWTYALCQQIQITPAVAAEVKKMGVAIYLWKHEKMLTVLSAIGSAVPFLPVVLWVGIAAALRSAAINTNRAQTPV